MPARQLIWAAALILLCLAPCTGLAGIGMGTSGSTLVDTAPPRILLQDLPEHLLLQGGQSYLFAWSALEDNPGEMPEDRQARVFVDGQVQAEITWTGLEHVWEWTAPEVQTSDCYLEVEFRDLMGNHSVERSSDFTVLLSTTEAPDLPGRVRLHAPFPNPFNPSCRLELELPTAARVRIDVFDARGRRVRELQQGLAPAGRTGLEWNGADHLGRPQPAGVYFFRLDIAGQPRQVRRAVLIP